MTSYLIGTRERLIRGAIKLQPVKATLHAELQTSLGRLAAHVAALETSPPAIQFLEAVAADLRTRVDDPPRPTSRLRLLAAPLPARLAPRALGSTRVYDPLAHALAIGSPLARLAWVRWVGRR